MKKEAEERLVLEIAHAANRLMNKLGTSEAPVLSAFGKEFDELEDLLALWSERTEPVSAEEAVSAFACRLAREIRSIADRRRAAPVRVGLYEAAVIIESFEKERMIVEIYKDKAGEWRWRLIAPNGEVVAVCGEGYKNKSHCVKMVSTLQGNSVATARVQILEKGE